jgi:hypothetical protein
MVSCHLYPRDGHSLANSIPPSSPIPFLPATIRPLSRFAGRSRSRSRSPPPRSALHPNSYASHNPGNNLHVSGLSHKIDTRDLEAAFAKIGRVKKASVMYDPHTRESRGFGFVTVRPSSIRLINDMRTDYVWVDL